MQNDSLSNEQQESQLSIERFSSNQQNELRRQIAAMQKEMKFIIQGSETYKNQAQFLISENKKLKQQLADAERTQGN